MFGMKDRHGESDQNRKKHLLGSKKTSTKTGELGFSFSNSANVPFEHKYKYVEHRVHLTGICQKIITQDFFW